MLKISTALSAALCAIFLSSCKIIRPGEVGVKQKFGQISERVYTQGAYGINPFTTIMIKTPTRTVNMEVVLNLPSKEGLNINSNISILFA